MPGLTVLQELGEGTRRGTSSAARGRTTRASPPAPASLRACAPRWPERYPLVDPAGLLMLAVPERSGWWPPPDSRPAAPASPPGAAALQPPSSLRGSGAGQVGVGCALRRSPGAQNSFHSGSVSILKFLPGSCKTAAAGMSLDTGHTRGQTNGETERRLEDEGKDSEEGVWKDRDGGTGDLKKKGLPREQKGQTPSLSPFRSLPAASHSALGNADCGQRSAHRRASGEGQRTRAQALASWLGAGRPGPGPGN